MLILIGPRSIYGNKGALEHLKDSVRLTEEQVGYKFSCKFGVLKRTVNLSKK